MLTKNYYAMAACQLTHNAIEGLAKKTNGDPITLQFNNTQSGGRGPLVPTSQHIVSYSSTAGVVYGAGETPATVDDYKLEELITSGLSVRGSSFLRMVDGGMEIVVDHTIYNGGSEGPITIREAGRYALSDYYKSETATSTTYIGLLWERTVLETPVTIPQGESRTVTYTVRINFPF